MSIGAQRIRKRAGRYGQLYLGVLEGVSGALDDWRRIRRVIVP